MHQNRKGTITSFYSPRFPICYRFFFMLGAIRVGLLREEVFFTTHLLLLLLWLGYVLARKRCGFGVGQIRVGFVSLWVSGEFVVVEIKTENDEWFVRWNGFGLMYEFGNYLRDWILFISVFSSFFLQFCCLIRKLGKRERIRVCWLLVRLLLIGDSVKVCAAEEVSV